MLKRAIVSLAVVAAFALVPSTGRPPSAWADTPDASAGSGSAEAPRPIICPAGQHVTTAPDGAQSCTELAPKSEQVPNPAEHPLEAWDDAKAAKKTSWPLLVWLSLVMLGKALAYGRDHLKGVPLVGWIARRMAIGKTAMLVAAVGAVGAAGYDVVIAGGSWVAGLVASGAALGGVLHSTTQQTKST